MIESELDLQVKAVEKIRLTMGWRRMLASLAPLSPVIGQPANSDLF